MDIVKPKSIRNVFFYFFGFILLILNKIRYSLAGYRTPRPFSDEDLLRVANYDIAVVENWLKYLRSYIKSDGYLKDKVVLELGPGPDLGTGVVLLSFGAKKYITMDVHSLAGAKKVDLYNKLLSVLKDKYSVADVSRAQTALDNYFSANKDAIDYVVDRNFVISNIQDKIDIVFSQAAFEHFDNIDNTIKELNKIVKPGGVLVAEVDLQTHTGCIRDKDPLNIYRFGDFCWNILKFKGALNRVTADKYKGLFENNGWVNVVIEPVRVLEKEYVKKVKPTLAKRFRAVDEEDMGKLSIMVMATRK